MTPPMVRVPPRGGGALVDAAPASPQTPQFRRGFLVNHTLRPDARAHSLHLYAYPHPRTPTLTPVQVFMRWFKFLLLEL